MIQTWQFRRAVIISSLIAWLILLWWSTSPYNAYIDHGDWTQVTHDMSSQMHSGGISIKTLTLSGVAWMLMVIAMMMPTLLSVPGPCVSRETARQKQTGASVFAGPLLVTGYLFMWLLFGLVAHIAGMFVQALSANYHYLVENGWIIGAGLLAVAGCYQLTPSKKNCLSRCRRALASSLEQQETRSLVGHLLIGCRFGLSCLGCCWALMLLMFVFWPGSILWMVFLSAFMLAERFVTAYSIRSHTGLALLSSSLAVVLYKTAL